MPTGDACTARLFQQQTPASNGTPPAAAQKPSPSPLENHLLALDGMKNARALAREAE